MLCQTLVAIGHAKFDNMPADVTTNRQDRLLQAGMEVGKS